LRALRSVVDNENKFFVAELPHTLPARFIEHVMSLSARSRRNCSLEYCNAAQGLLRRLQVTVSDGAPD